MSQPGVQGVGDTDAWLVQHPDPWLVPCPTSDDGRAFVSTGIIDQHQLPIIK
jgi:hypothetical protein